MPNALRKKIDMATGLPPSVLELRVLWQLLTNRIANWSRVMFDYETGPVIEARRVLTGESVKDIVDSEAAACFDAAASPGLATIVFDRNLAMHATAVRLRQLPESLADTSSLFLKLMCEQPSASLWRELAEDLPSHANEGDDAPLGEAQNVTGGFEPDRRYLKVAVRLGLAEGEGRVFLVFDMDYLQSTARILGHVAGGTGSHVSEQGRMTLRDRVRGSVVTLDAVLNRVTLTIGDCSRLQVGQVLPLPGLEADRLTLCAETVNGNVDIGEGQLGVWKQRRAMKLTSEVSERFTRDMADL